MSYHFLSSKSETFICLIVLALSAFKPEISHSCFNPLHFQMIQIFASPLHPNYMYLHFSFFSQNP